MLLTLWIHIASDSDPYRIGLDTDPNPDPLFRVYKDPEVDSPRAGVRKGCVSGFALDPHSVRCWIQVSFRNADLDPDVQIYINFE